MKAICFSEHGDPDKLEFADLPEPQAGSGRIVVRLQAAALNHLDLFVLSGFPGLSVAFPHIPGADGAGIVESVPAGEGQLQEGDRVLLDPGISCGECELCSAGEHSMCAGFHLLGEHVDGTFAQYVAVPRANVHKVPEHLDIHEAAAFPLTYCTAWRMLVARGRLKPGEWVLIPGAGGGVSLAALQIAHRIGARTIVTSSSKDKLDLAGTLGAEHLVNHRETDFSREARRITGGRGVDLVVENVGKATWEKSLASLRKGGRLVTCGATTGPEGATNINRVFWNQLEIIGSTMASRGDFQQMLRFVAASGLRPVVDSRFDLNDARSAYLRLKEARQTGKIVLDIPS